MARGRKAKVNTSIDELIAKKKEEIKEIEVALKAAKKELKEYQNQKNEETKNELFEALEVSGKKLDDVMEFLLGESGSSNETTEENPVNE